MASVMERRVLLEFPLSVVQRANLTRFQPSRDAVEVKRVIAHTPGNSAFLRRVRALIRLALDTKVHDVISANGTVVHHNVPSPQSHRAPLLDFKPLLTWWTRVI